MGFQVNFYTVAKKKNSFFRPTGDGGLQITCTLKSPCGILKPVIVVASAQNEFNPSQYNYCYIPSFSRYYFVRNWVFESGGVCSAELEVDVLASFKDDIGSKNFYFTRSSTLYDDSITDLLYPATTAVMRNNQFVDLWGNAQGETSWQNGCVVVNTIGQEGTAQWYYADVNAFAQFCKTVFSNIDWTNIDFESIDLNEAVAKLVFDPFEYILSAKWFPVKPTPITEVEQVFVGWWAVPVTGWYSFDQSQVYYKNVSCNLSSHPSAGSRGLYVNKPPFHSMYLESQLFGSLPLNTMMVDVNYSLNLSCGIDFGTGACRLMVGQNNVVYATTTGNCALDLILTSMRENLAGELTSVAGGIGELFSGNWLGLVSGIGSAIATALNPDTHARGSGGGSFASIGRIQVTQMFKGLTSFDDADNGRPCCKNGVMSALGNGFYIVENGNVPITGAYSEEIDSVRSFLEGGVYYE